MKSCLFTCRRWPCPDNPRAPEGARGTAGTALSRPGWDWEWPAAHRCSSPWRHSLVAGSNGAKWTMELRSGPDLMSYFTYKWECVVFTGMIIECHLFLGWMSRCQDCLGRVLKQDFAIVQGQATERMKTMFSLWWTQWQSNTHVKAQQHCLPVNRLCEQTFPQASPSKDSQ